MWPWLFGSPCAQLVYLGDLSEILKIVNKHTRPPSRLTRQPKTPPSVRQSIPSRTVCADCSTWASATTIVTTITILFPTAKKPEWPNLVLNCLVLVPGINLNQLGTLINNHCLIVALVESVGQGVCNLRHNFCLPWMHALDNTLFFPTLHLSYSFSYCLCILMVVELWNISQDQTTDLISPAPDRI